MACGAPQVPPLSVRAKTESDVDDEATPTSEQFPSERHASPSTTADWPAGAVNTGLGAPQVPEVSVAIETVAPTTEAARHSEDVGQSNWDVPAGMACGGPKRGSLVIECDNDSGERLATDNAATRPSDALTITFECYAASLKKRRCSSSATAA